MALWQVYADPHVSFPRRGLLAPTVVPSHASPPAQLMWLIRADMVENQPIKQNEDF